MARPEEKAQNMLNKWVTMRKEADSTNPYKNKNSSSTTRRRPWLASECDHLHDAEKWRREIVREIGNGIREIQNAGMGEHAIRDLNDKINKLMREKWHWNKRIKELGGLDFNGIERRQQVREGDLQGLMGTGGYRYFGAAKDLPGVRELFTRQAKKMAKRKRGDVYKYITPDYYGLRDEEDGVLLQVEEEWVGRQEERMKRLKREYEAKMKERQAVAGQQVSGRVFDENSDEEEGMLMGGAISAQLAVPTQDVVTKLMLERKKKELLERLTF